MHVKRSCTKLVLLMVFALTTACTHYVSVEVEPDRLHELAAYGAGESVVLDKGADGESGVELTKDHEPAIVVSRDYRCSFSELMRHRCDSMIDVPLEQMSVTDETATFKVRTALFAEEYRAIDVPLDNIDGAKVRLKSYMPRDWQPRWGLGIMMAGPAALASLTGQYFPADWVAIELGLSPLTPVLNGFTGFRIRPFEFGGRLRPFVGTWINLLMAVDADSSDSSMWSSTGLRAGLDLQLLASKRWMLTLEANLARPLLENRELIEGYSGEWLPWGGLTTSILF